jgi:ATP-dependent DNA helicase PIF1
LFRYASKAEGASQDLKAVLTDVMGKMSATDDAGGLVASLVTKFMNRLIGERDISAQEACHLLLRLPLVDCSRTFTRLNLAEESSRRVSKRRTTDLSPLQRYAQRDVRFEDVSLFEIATQYYVQHGKYIRRKRGRDSVAVVWPHHSNDPVSPSYELFARSKLLLHHPWRRQHDLLVDEDAIVSDGEAAVPLSWLESFERCRTTDVHPSDALGPARPPEDEDESDYDPLAEETDS